MLEKSSSNTQSGLGLQISLGLYILTPHLTNLLLACKFPSSPFQGYSCLDHLVIQLLSHVWLFVTPQTAACQTSLSVTNSQSLLRLKSVEPVMTSTNAEHMSIHTECYKVAVSNRIVLWNGGLGKNIHSFIFRIFFRMLGQEWTIRYEG